MKSSVFDVEFTATEPLPPSKPGGRYKSLIQDGCDAVVTIQALDAEQAAQRIIEAYSDCGMDTNQLIAVSLKGGRDVQFFRCDQDGVAQPDND